MNIQQPYIRRLLDLLTPSPLNTNMPTIDEERISWTLSTPPQWVAPRLVAWRSSNISINGTNAQCYDDGSTAGFTYDSGDVRDMSIDGVFYTAVMVTLAGGTVSPIEIEMRVDVRQPAGTYVSYIHQISSIVNPDIGILGPVYIPPRAALNIRNATAGGAGDTMAVRAFGFQHAEGTPPILTPPRT